jgi:hypothetical protein
MSYRAPQEDDQKRARDQLQALAARGADLAPQTPSAAATTSATERLGEWRQRRQAARQLRRSCSRFAELEGFWIRFVTFPVSLGALFVAMPLVSPAVILAWGLGVWLAVVIVATVLGRLVSTPAARKERRWVEGLPFPVSGYLEALQLATTTSVPWHQSSRNAITYPAVAAVTVQVELADPIDSRAFAHNLLRATLPNATLGTAEARRLSFSQDKIGCHRSAFRLRRWFHVVEDHLLTPVHQGHHVRRVEMRTTKYEGPAP